MSNLIYINENDKRVDEMNSLYGETSEDFLTWLYTSIPGKPRLSDQDETLIKTSFMQGAYHVHVKYGLRK